MKSATQLRGLTFGNRIDELLQGGLLPNTFVFVYGKNSQRSINTLCGNAVRIFGGRSVFIDAANSFDPYFIVKSCMRKKDASDSKKLLKSIIVSRAFTCYQLTDLVMKQLPKLLSCEKHDNDASSQIRSVFVSGISDAFNEQDNTASETERLQLLMASTLRKVASDKKNGVLFVVCSSKTRCEEFVLKADTSIKLFEDNKTGEDKAILMKHHTRQFAEIKL